HSIGRDLDGIGRDPQPGGVVLAENRAVRNDRRYERVHRSMRFMEQLAELLRRPAVLWVERSNAEDDVRHTLGRRRQKWQNADLVARSDDQVRPERPKVPRQLENLHRLGRAGVDVLDQPLQRTTGHGLSRVSFTLEPGILAI